MKKLLAALLILSLLVIGFCACSDNTNAPAADPADSAAEQTEDTSDSSGNNADTDGNAGDEETVKEPEGTESPNPDEDGHWTPNYVPTT